MQRFCLEHIRLIEERDLPQIQDLYNQLSLSGASTQLSLEDVQRSATAGCLMIGWIPLEDGRHIIGMGWTGALYTMSGNKSYIDHVVVDEAWRGKGVAKIIVQALIANSANLSVKQVMLTSRATRVAAGKIYTSLGFKERDTRAFRLDLKI